MQKPYDWEQEDALGYGAEAAQERPRGVRRGNPYLHPIYLDPDRQRPATEERIESMVREGFKEIKEFLDER